MKPNGLLLGRALVSNPKCLCLDEPLSALDQGLKQRILPYLERLRDKTQIQFFTLLMMFWKWHGLLIKFVLIRGGKTILSGQIDEILSNPIATPILGVRSAGTVISARVMPQDSVSGLAVVSFAGGELFLPELFQPEGAKFELELQLKTLF